jgi:peptide/nickel transport system ATP-binding protein/oligopeptide transport system ATP-binding protein
MTAESSAATTRSASSSGSAEPLLSVRGLGKRFPVARDFWGRPTSWLSAVDDVDLDVQPGETVALVGESGCGKSTLARLILRLIPATTGTVTYDGTDVLAAKGPELKRFRRQAQLVFQDPYGSLDPRMKVDAIVAEGMSRESSAGERRERLIELLDFVELSPDALDRFPHEFSGGQRQRISIARALAVDPAFLIADEPVSALDVSVQSRILNLLHDLQERLNLTYLFISHDMSVVRHVADRIAVMYLGKIVETAPAAEIFDNPLHPYTQALLSSVPTLTRRRFTKRIVLEGDVPNAIDPPQACRFAGRCFRVIDHCRVEVPPLDGIAGNAEHRVACFNYEPIASTTGEGRGRPGDDG